MPPFLRSPAQRDQFNQNGTGGQKAVFARTNTVAYTDTTAKVLFTLPRDARILNVIIDVDVAFNDTGTDQLSVGKSGTNSHFVSALDVSSTGRKSPTLTNTGTVGTADIPVVGIYAGQNGNASTGQATVTVSYVLS
jgi:hypothetical protein